jgi:hypothetical protein
LWHYYAAFGPRFGVRQFPKIKWFNGVHEFPEDKWWDGVHDQLLDFSDYRDLKNLTDVVLRKSGLRPQYMWEMVNATGLKGQLKLTWVDCRTTGSCIEGWEGQLLDLPEE